MDIVAPPPFRAPDYVIRFASETWELAGAADLRQAVFCREQGVFQGHDRDAIDEVAIPLVAISTLAGELDQVVGTVRIHEAEPAMWWGSRLAVAASHRRVGTLGPALIRLAVTSANAMGCVRFHAHVQSQNELLFRRLHWKRVDEIELHGLPHTLMQADLAHYPPFADGLTGFRAEMRRAA
nr:MSMEG_0567/Sll0786 family nitrogen starvation N-acetyltransferase [Sphingomonas sp. CDS-1]